MKSERRTCIEFAIKEAGKLSLILPLILLFYLASAALKSFDIVVVMPVLGASIVAYGVLVDRFSRKQSRTR